jgi:hypothetical protein
VEGEESMSEDVSEILVTVANLREERKMLLGALDGVLGRSERTLGEGHQEQDRALQEICGIARAAFQSAREPWKPTPEGLLSRIEADGHVLTFDPPLRVEQGRNYRMKVTLKGPVGGPSFPDLASQAVLRESRAEQINELLSAARDAVSSGADAPPLALVMERLRSVIASMDAHSPTQGAAVAGPAPCRCGHVGAEACLLSGPPPPAVAGPACACSQPGEPRSRCGGLAAGDCPCACHEEDASKAATGPAPGCPTCGQLCPLIVGGHYVCTRPLPHAYAPEEVLASLQALAPPPPSSEPRTRPKCRFCGLSIGLANRAAAERDEATAAKAALEVQLAEERAAHKATRVELTEDMAQEQDDWREADRDRGSAIAERDALAAQQKTARAALRGTLERYSGTLRHHAGLYAELSALAASEPGEVR